VEDEVHTVWLYITNCFRYEYGWFQGFSMHTLVFDPVRFSSGIS
jgi:hypothetical protein